MEASKWPKILAPLTEEQQKISNDFMAYWLKTLSSHQQYHLIEKFNHGYAVQHAPKNFQRTLEIGAGIGEHLKYEKLTYEQKKDYHTLEIRENVAAEISNRYPDINSCVGDCQKTLPFPDHYFDRILAIHVLEHLPNLPSAIQEMHRLCDKTKGIFSVVIPCEGGMAYTLARKISAERLFKHRYKQPYQWFIEREHINLPHEIMTELDPYFKIIHRRFFPLMVPIIHFNLCIGLTLRPR